ncbi:MAG: Fic family protein [Hyphomicrobium sp.]|nr:Fic family protein [Hyphomicrobium sp.]
MKTHDFAQSPSGRLVPTIGGRHAYVPNDLPPKIEIASLVNKLSSANLALGELNGIARTLKNPYLLIRPLQVKEALTSSRMEGTYATADDLLLADAGFEGSELASDAREVSNYARALREATKSLADLPLCLRTIRNAHAELLSGVAPNRGATVRPGEFKHDQNWIGTTNKISDARFIPPPAAEAQEAMGQLEKYIQRETREDTPVLLDSALIHYQFEAIHPFSDGNGRVGRMLITLHLTERGALKAPLLYMSPYLEAHKQTYIDLMYGVSKFGNWIEWVDFYLTAVLETCKETVRTADRLSELRDQTKEKLRASGRSAGLLLLADYIFLHPVFSIPQLADYLSVTYRSAQANIEVAVEAGVLRLVPKTTQPKYYVAPQVMKVIFES